MPLKQGYIRYSMFLTLVNGDWERTKAHWCSAKARRIELPPEVCILHKGLKGCLWRGAFRLPSILCGLENELLAAELRDSIHVEISAFKVRMSTIKCWSIFFHVL